MREEIGSPPGPGAGAAAGDAPTTPWRGRVVSLGLSHSARRSVAGAGTPAAAAAAERWALSPPDPAAAARDSPLRQPGEDRVLLLRQSTAEASSLRRQVAALQGELDLLRTAAAAAAPAPPRAQGEDGASERVAALERELDAAREREDAARRDWGAERREMEDEMAELAAAAASSSSSSSSSPSAAPAPAPVILGVPPARLHALELDLVEEKARAAREAARRAWGAVEAGARSERADLRGEVEALRALSAGLSLWGM